MRAVQVTRFGAPEVLVLSDLPDPVVGPGEMVIDVSVAEVLYLDTQLRSGWGRDFFPLEPPFVPGVGVAGTVRAVGPGIDPVWIGREVVAGTGKSGSYDGGGYAERAIVAADDVYGIPETLASSDALAALHDGLTALSRLDRAAIKPGERVLVTAAGGGLGAWLVPLARSAGGFVVGAARGERKLAHVRGLGADLAVDYAEAGWLDEAGEATDGRGFDVVFDGAGGQIGSAAFELTAEGGRFFSHGAAAGTFADINPQVAEQREITVVGIDVRIPPDEWIRLTERALSVVAEGHVKPTIGQIFPLERAADAHAVIEAREAIGKTLLATS